MVAKTRQDLAKAYGIDRKTLYRWIKKAQLVLSGSGNFTPKDLELIFATFGKPKKIQ